ncbi:hypothetical protein V8E53_010625, partial [Lactarius tabidus]
MSTTLLQLVHSSSHSDHSHVSPCPLSTVEISSLNHGPPSSLGKVLPVPIHAAARNFAERPQSCTIATLITITT